MQRPSAANVKPKQGKRQRDDSTPRYFNFPVSLLEGTLDDAEQGLLDIAFYALGAVVKNYSLKWEDALGRLAYRVRLEAEPYASKSDLHLDYWLDHETTPPLSTAVRTLLQQDKKVKALAYRAGAWIRNLSEDEKRYGNEISYMEGMKWQIAETGIILSESQKSDVLEWARLDKASEFFGYPLGIVGYDTIPGRIEAICRTIEDHKRALLKNRTPAPASVRVDFFRDTLELVRSFSRNETSIQGKAQTVKQLRLFRMVCAVRSIVGDSPFYGTTKKIIAARCIGATTGEIAEVMAEQNPRVREELHVLRPAGKTFDTIIKLGRKRRFYVHEGSRERRCIYLSTTAETRAQLASLAVRTRKEEDAATADAALARDILLGLKPPLPKTGTK